MNSKRYFLSNLFWAILGIFVLIYLLIQFLSVTLPPKIVVSQPEKKELKTSSEDLVVRGLVRRTYFLKINDEPIPFDSKGNFEKKILLKQELNILNIEAESRFGKKTTESFKILKISK